MMKKLILAAALLAALAAPALAQNSGSSIGPVGPGASSASVGNFTTVTAATSVTAPTVTGTSKVSSPAYVQTGTSPTTTGSTCTTGAQVGGNAAGTIVLTCTAQVLVLNFATAAPNGWTCRANDRTTVADLFQQTASTATSATFGSTTTGTSDVIQFNCAAF